MIKVFVDPDDSAEVVVGKLALVDDPEVMLVIPKNTAIKGSVKNFHSLRKGAEAQGKKISIETVDDDVLALAKSSRIPAEHSFFRKGQGGPISDIVPGRAETRESIKPERKEIKGKGIRKEEEREEPPSALHGARGVPLVEAEKEERQAREYPREKRGRRTLWGAVVLAVVIAVGGAVWIVSTFMSRAEIVVDLRETPWEFSGDFIATKTAGAVNPSRNILPAEVFSEEKNLVETFPASGRGNAAQRAKGTLTIYNAYGTGPQTLVGTTRFVTPDGKIFRLDDVVEVPGAKRESGKLLSSNIDAAVTADKAGPAYNIGPVSRLAIPGFKGSLKYDGFYGELKQGASGGFIGERAIATEKDIADAKRNVTEKLLGILRANLGINIPSGFKVLEGASEVKTVKATANVNTDEKGNFSVFVQGRSQAVAFREGDLKSLLGILSSRDFPDTAFRDLAVTYANMRPRFDRGEVTFSGSAKGTLWPQFSADSFKTRVLGQKVSETMSLLKAREGVEGVTIALWPRWLTRIPKKEGRVKVVVQ